MHKAAERYNKLNKMIKPYYIFVVFFIIISYKNIQKKN